MYLFYFFRDPQSKIAHSYRRKGVHVVKADLNDKSTLYKAIQGATGVFLVTRPNYSDYKNNYFYELEQFRNVGEVCKDCGEYRFVERVNIVHVIHLRTHMNWYS